MNEHFFRDELRGRVSNVCINGNILEFSGKRPGTHPSQLLSAMITHGRVMHLVELGSGRGLIVCEDSTAAERILGSSPLLADTSIIRLSQYRPR